MSIEQGRINALRVGLENILQRMNTLDEQIRGLVILEKYIDDFGEDFGEDFPPRVRRLLYFLRAKREYLMSSYEECDRIIALRVWERDGITRLIPEGFPSPRSVDDVGNWALFINKQYPAMKPHAWNADLLALLQVTP